MGDPRNHGLTWTDAHKQQLNTLWDQNHGERHAIKYIANIMGRTTVSIECKLKSLGWAKVDECGNYQYIPEFERKQTTVTGPILTVNISSTSTNSCIDEGEKHMDLHKLLMENNRKYLVKPQKEIQMAFQIKVETKTFINGYDAVSLTDDALLSMIANAERELESIDKIINKPKMLVQRKEDLQKGIMQIVNIMDSK